VIDTINIFLSSFDRFEILTNDIKSIDIDEYQKNATVNFLSITKACLTKAAKP